MTQHNNLTSKSSASRVLYADVERWLRHLTPPDNVRRVTPFVDPYSESYVEELAQFVESRMALASKSSPSSDAVGLAILTALNITDEYFRARDHLTNNSGNLTARAEALERMVDQALALAE